LVKAPPRHIVLVDVETVGDPKRTLELVWAVAAGRRAASGAMNAACKNKSEHRGSESVTVDGWQQGIP
jgi:hypothetical protein